MNTLLVIIDTKEHYNKWLKLANPQDKHVIPILKKQDYNGWHNCEYIIVDYTRKFNMNNFLDYVRTNYITLSTDYVIS